MINMGILSLVLFFLYTWSFGFLLCSFVKESDNALEKNLMRVGIGLGFFIFLGFIFNLLHIPLDWRIFLFIVIAGLLFHLYKNYRTITNIKPRIKISKSNMYILLMLILFFISFYMYHKGAFAYPYLEDDDSWSHALAVKYVSIEKTVFEKTSVGFHYIDPYPPAYDMFFGIMHQTNNSVYWTLKFLNALIVSLSIIFFYFFAKVFTNSSKKALFSTFALFAVPAFLSHFIWALAITMPLFFVSFYAIEKIKDDKKWWIISAIVIMPTLTSSPTHSTYFGLFLVLYLITKIILERKLLLYHIFAGLFGILLSFVLWWLPMIIKHGFLDTLISLGVIESAGAELIVGGAGTGDRIYNFADFFIAQGQNLVNNPVGIGKVLFILAFISLLLIFYHFFTLSKEVKERSKVKSYFVTGFSAFAAILFVIGIFLFISSNNFNPWVKEEAKLLAEHIKLTLFFIFLSFVLLIGLAFLFSKYINENNKWIIISLVWLLLTLYAVNATPYPYKISPFRAWMLLAIPVSLLSGEAINWINNFVKSLARNFTKSDIAIAGISLIVLGLVTYGIIMTSFVQKYTVNTSPTWPPGGFWTSNEEIQGYIWFKDNIPSGTKVFTFSNNALIIGLDKFICHWCDDVQDYSNNGFNQTADENYNWLKQGEYEYIIIDGQAARIFGANETNNKLQGFINSNKFKPIFNNNGMVIFGV